MTSEQANGTATKIVGALGVGITVTGAGIAGSALLAGDTTVAGAGALLIAVGAGLTAAYNFLHQH